MQHTPRHLVRNTPRRRLRRLLALLGTLFTLLLGASLVAPLRPAPASAAEEKAAEEKAPAEEKKKKVDPIAITEIGVASQRAKREFAELGADLEPTEDVKAVGEQLPALRESVKTQLELSASVRAEETSAFALDKLKNAWNEISDRVDGLQGVLADRAKGVAKDLERIQSQREVWSATREAAVASDASVEVLKQIDEVEKASKVALKKAQKRQAAVVELQSSVASLHEELVVDLKRIGDLRGELVGKVFTQDRPAFWSAEFWHILDAEEVRARVGTQSAQDTEATKAFWAKRRRHVYQHLLLTGVLLAAMYYVRSSIRAHFDPEEEGAARVRAIFDGPISLALLASFFSSAIRFQGDAGQALTPLLSMASLIPAVLILRRIVDPSMHAPLYVVVVVYFIEYVREGFLLLPLLPRLIYVAEMSIIIAVAALWLRPARLSKIPHSLAGRFSLRVVGWGLKISLLAAAAGILAEIAGYGGLANVIGQTLVFAGYAAVVLYGLARVLDGLITFLLRVRPLRLLGMVRRNRSLIQRRAIQGIHVLGWYVWIRATLKRAQLEGWVEDAIASTLAAELPLPEISITVGDLLASVLTFYIAMLTSRFIRFALNEDVFTRVKLHKGRPYAISTLIHYSIVLIGFLLAAAVLGFDANRFTLLAGAFGVGIGFGMQTIVNNFISGIILLTERPIDVGDTIALGEVFGEVKRIGIRSSTVRTWQGAEVLVPNADLIALQVTNWTHSDRRRRMEIPVGVAYGSDPQVVIKALLSVAKGEPHVLKDPEPYVLFQGFGDSSLDFELRAWTDEFDSFLTVRSAIAVGIVDALEQAGLEVPFPQRDLHVKTIPEQSGRRHQDERPPAPDEQRAAEEREPGALAGAGGEQKDRKAG